jgi:hypothetical protein
LILQASFTFRNPAFLLATTSILLFSSSIWSPHAIHDTSKSASNGQIIAHVLGTSVQQTG